jgi:acyl-coenzyme A synthetase/AMP-(fatty) acid ligase
VNSNLDAIEHLSLSPQILALYLEDENLNEATFKRLQSIMISGSATPQVLVEKAFSRLGVEIYSSYGSTEVGPVANMQLAAGIDSHDAVGYVYPWIDLEIVDEGSPVQEGEEGLVRIRSPYMADQYHADPASTERAYKDGWFYPGDLGRLTEGRLLHVTGRVNEVINIGGLKIAPHRIEHFIRAQPQVRDAAAFGNPSESGVEQVWLAIVTSGPVDFEQLHQKCVERFGPVAAPVRILHITSIPRTETGKIQRSRLKALLTQDSKPAPMAG